MKAFTEADLAALRRGFRAMHKAVQDATWVMLKAFRPITAALRNAANHEVHVSGLEARYYVRGGLLCPDIDALVRTLLREPWAAAPPDEQYFMRLLSPENRARLAAAAIRGSVGA